jgi:hypothetical protein
MTRAHDGTHIGDTLLDAETSTVKIIRDALVAVYLEQHPSHTVDGIIARCTRAHR